MTSDAESIQSLKRVIAEQRMKYFSAIHNKENHFRLLGCCELSINSDFKITRTVNPYPVIGVFDDTKQVTALFSEDDTADYFQWFIDIPDQMLEFAESTESSAWEIKFDSTKSNGVSMLDFHTLPEGSWELTGEHGMSSEIPHAEGLYLIYPTEIISNTDDFRIEYTARADDNPCDLSCVVGPPPVFSSTQKRFVQIPEDNGYCFGFGALSNELTQLQRCWRPMVSVKKSIEKGREYRCVAERVGGRLRYSVDGEPVYEYIDPLPIMKLDHGNVGFYTYGMAHKFSNIQIFTRPTCLNEDILKKINLHREMVFTLAGYPSRKIRVHPISYNRSLKTYTYLVQIVASGTRRSASGFRTPVQGYNV